MAGMIVWYFSIILYFGPKPAILVAVLPASCVLASLIKTTAAELRRNSLVGGSAADGLQVSLSRRSSRDQQSEGHPCFVHCVHLMFACTLSNKCCLFSVVIRLDYYRKFDKRYLPFLT